jgi:hypothetical protein
VRKENLGGVLKNDIEPNYRTVLGLPEKVLPNASLDEVVLVHEDIRAIDVHDDEPVALGLVEKLQPSSEARLLFILSFLYLR